LKTQEKILVFTSDSLGTCPLQVISQVKTQGKILIFPSDSLGTSHRHVTGHTKNEYKEQVKSRRTSKNFHLNFHLWKCGHPIQFSIWSVTCSSLVQEDMSHGIHKVIHKCNFFFGTEGNCMGCPLFHKWK